MDSRESRAGAQRTLVRERPGWFRRQCPAPFGLVRSEAWKRQASVVHLGAALAAVVIYSMIHKLYGFLARIFITQYRYSYVAPLTFAQAAVTLLVLSSLRAVGCVTLSPYSPRLGERLLVPAVCDGVDSALALWAEVHDSGGLYPLVRSLLPLACVGWSHVLGLTPCPSKHATLLLLAVTLVSLTLTGSKGFPMAQPLGCFYSALSLLLHSLSLGWLAKVAEAEKGGEWERAPVLDIYYSLTVNKNLVLGFLCLLHPDSPQMLRDGSWHSLLFLGYLLGLMLLGSLQRLLLGVAATHYSPLAAALLPSAHDLAKPFSSLL